MKKRKWSKLGVLLAILYFILITGVYIFEARSCGVSLRGEFCGLGITFFTLPSIYFVGVALVPIVDYFGSISLPVFALLGAILNTIIIYYLGKGIDKLFSYL